MFNIVVQAAETANYSVSANFGELIQDIIDA